jgi:hypothetical protein
MRIYMNTVVVTTRTYVFASTPSLGGLEEIAMAA